MAIQSEKPEIDYIRYLKNNLLDTYKYGDGFTIFKELIQNASDASSDSLKVYILDSLKNTQCAEALKTTAIVVYDDGHFDKKNKSGILKIASDNKTSESTKIGRYGLGMKSIFHICDFFIYAANTNDFPYERVFPVNYWPDTDERFKNFSENDMELVLNSLPQEIDIRKQKGFILYIPLKIIKPGWTNVISDPISPYPFGSLESLKKRIPISLALLSEVAPQEKKLKSISYSQKEGVIKVDVNNNNKIKKINITCDEKRQEIEFIAYKPEISTEIIKKTEKLKESEYWTTEQKENLNPEVCFELLRTKKENKALLTIHFCVYLPLEDEYCSQSFEINSKYNYTILIHANFAVDSGRRGIRGFASLLDETTELGIDSEEGIQKLWNKLLAQMVLFPEIPRFLHEARELILEHTDYCEISNKLCEASFFQSGRNIKLCNSFTIQNYGFANIYGIGWSSIKLEKEKSNYILLPYSKDKKDIQALFPLVEERNIFFILKAQKQRFILPDAYHPDKEHLVGIIKNIPHIALTEEKYILALTDFLDFHKTIISDSRELQEVIINHIKSLLVDLTLDDLAKHQTRLSELFGKINEATGTSSYKVYAIGQKDKSDLQRLYSLEDFKIFWKKESSFIFVPGFIPLINEALTQIKEQVYSGDDTVCDFIKDGENCRPHLHLNILSSILGSLFENSLQDIANKYPTLQIFRVTEAFSNTPENLNYQLLNTLISQKKIFTTQSNPADKETVFFYFVKTVYPISIYHISKKNRELAGFNNNEIPTSDDPSNIFSAFSKLYGDSIKRGTDDDYKICFDLTDKFWYQLLDEGFKISFKIKETEKDFYRFLFSGFDKELKTEPLISFDDDVPDVWKEVYKNIEPDARMIPHKIPARAKEQIKINQKLLNINYFDKNDCRDKLRIYEKNSGNLDFFKSEYFQDPQKQKFLFEIFNNNEENLYKAIPLHVSAEMGNLIDAKGKAYLNPEKIIFPEECDIRIKLIKISDDADLQDIQNRFISSLTIKDAIVEALASKKQNTDISSWIFQMMRTSRNHFKDIFETSQEHNYFHWIPLKTDKCKRFCDIQDILNDKIFSADSREWISQHYEMFNISDLDITASDIELLQNKKLLAETCEEQMNYIGRKGDKLLSFKLHYEDSNTFFSDCILLKDFKNEPIFGLLNILKQERANNPHQVFEFYTQRKVLNQTAAGGKVFEELLNFISNTHEVTPQSLSLYERILHLLLQKDEFDISSIKYPTQNNQWKPANEVSLSNSSSIAPEYLLHQNIYKLLSEHNQIKGNNYSNITDDNPSDEIELTDSSAQELIRKTFVEWEKNLEKKNLLYLFFYLLKDTFKNIATEELNEKKLLPLTNDLIYHRIDNSGSDRHFWSVGYTKEQAIMDINPTRGHFKVRVHIPKGKITRVRSLAGSLMRIEIVEGSELYTDTPWYSKNTNQFHVYLINTTSRVIDLDNKLENLISLIWKQGYKQRSEAEFKKMLRNFKESNQNTIKTAQLFMFENLILHLKDLNLNNPFFKEIFKEYTNLLDEKTRKENTEEEFHKYIEKKNILSQKLIDYITSEKVEADYLTEDIFNCVIRKINQAQYDQSRILFELLQNADDSVNDLVLYGEDIKGRTKFIVVDSCNKSTGKQAIHVSHFGRLINESLDRTKEDKFANDLLNMLLINSSDKDGESTGRFGLGFKSVYFICQEPILRSGDLQFKIRGALYPENVQSDSLSSHETRIELTLNNKANLDTIYGEFEKNADLQALFCKHINEIYTRGNHYKPKLHKGIKSETGLYYSENKKYLKFSLKSGTIVFKVSQLENNVESFGESSVSRIWNLTPLATAKTFPFAINSSFEVDIGRKNLDETNEINKSKLQDISTEFTLVLSNIIDANNGYFYHFLPSILTQLLNGCNTKDSVLLNNFCKNVLVGIYNSKKIIPDGIGGIKTNPTKFYYIAPTKFNFEYNTDKFNKFVKVISTAISQVHIVTRNVVEALTDTAIEFDEIDSSEKILELISGKRTIDNDTAIKFMEIVELMPCKLPTTFNWEMFKVLDSDGGWNDIRTVLMTNSFSKYSEEVRLFFKRHITFESAKRNHFEKKVSSSEADKGLVIFSQCTVLDIYNEWKSLTEEDWTAQKEIYYKKLFPDIMQDKTQRKKDLNITPDYFDTYEVSRPTMPISWCILFMLGNLQSQNYWGEAKAGIARRNKIESLMELISLFCDGNTLDSLYDEYLKTHQTSEDDLVEFESLLRVYKFRSKFMEIWAQFYGIKSVENVELNMLLNPSTAAQASGKSFGTYSSQKSLKYGISMVIRELLDNGFFGNTEKEQEKAFINLNKYTYIPHAYLRRIVFNDWTVHPQERTSEEIHDKILQLLEAEGLHKEEIKEFMKCHDLPFLILGDRK